MKKTFINYLIVPVILVMLGACSSDFLDTKPTGSLSQDQQNEVAIEDPIKAFSPIISGLYNSMIGYYSNHDEFGHPTVFLGTDLMANDMVQLVNHWFYKYYLNNDRMANDRSSNHYWTKLYYPLIYNCNLVLKSYPREGYDNLSDDAKILAGQALAVRANSYYYLVRLFAKNYKGNEDGPGVPIWLAETDAADHQPRVKISAVYTQIVQDLEDAIKLLEGQPRESINNVDYYTACAILADVSLTINNWGDAVKYAQEARKGSATLSTIDTYMSQFKGNLNASEWIWGMDINGENTNLYASLYSHLDNTIDGYCGIGVYKAWDARLYEQIPQTDIRRQCALPNNQYISMKYQTPGDFTGDICYIRIAEMYLIEAEAQARAGNDGLAQNILYELVKNRDPQATKSTKTGNDLIEEILFQKRIEMWGEGRSWFDLKRVGGSIERKNTINGVATNHRIDAQLQFGPNDNHWVFQIPIKEIEANQNINEEDQNPA